VHIGCQVLVDKTFGIRSSRYKSLPHITVDESSPSETHHKPKLKGMSWTFVLECGLALQSLLGIK